MPTTNTIWVSAGVRRCTKYDIPAHPSIPHEKQLLGDNYPSAALLHTYLQQGEVWCVAPKGGAPVSYIGFMPFASLLAHPPSTCESETAKTAALMLPQTHNVLWVGCACGDAEHLTPLLREVCHRAAQRHPLHLLAAPLYAQHTQSLQALFAEGFTAGALRPMAYLRPCYLFIKTPGEPAPTLNSVGAKAIPLGDTYEISRLMEQGYKATALAGPQLLHLQK